VTVGLTITAVAFADTRPLIADPAHASVAVPALLDAAHAAKRATQVCAAVRAWTLFS
jgi:hypothetical protein